jgi:anti-anti-sigma factor
MSPISFEPDFKLAVTTGDSGPVIRVQGELDSGTCEELEAVFRTTLADHPGRSLTLDLSGVGFIDSAGTRSVIMIEREAGEVGVEFFIVAPANEVTELLRTAGVIGRPQLRPDARRTAVDSSSLLERVELELPREPQSPARARAEVGELLAGRDQTQVADAVLLMSELVTNAVIHPDGAADTSIGLRIFTYEDGIRIEVDDEGEGFDPTLPSEPQRDRGRGLVLVDRFASRWGTDHVRDDRGRRFMVWFELDWRRQRDVETPSR